MNAINHDSLLIFYILTGAPSAAGADVSWNGALGKFLKEQSGVSDLSGGKGIVLRGRQEDIWALSQALRRSAQFRRLSPWTARALGRADEDPMVLFYLLTSTHGPPALAPGFNQS